MVTNIPQITIEGEFSKSESFTLRSVLGQLIPSINKPNILLLVACPILFCGWGCRFFSKDYAFNSVEKQRILEQSERAVNRGDFERAEHLLSKATQNSPDDPDLRWHLALLREHQKDYPAAIKEFRNCALLAPGECRGYRQMAKILYEQEKYNAAQLIAEEALIHNPDDADSLLILARLEKMKSNQTLAKSYYQRAITSDPQNSNIQIELGQYYISQNEHDRACPLLRRSIQNDYLPAEKKALAHWTLGKAYSALGRMDDSLSAYDTALALNYQPAPDELKLVAELNIQSGRTKRGEELIVLASSQMPVETQYSRYDVKNTEQIKVATLPGMALQK